MLGVGVAGTEYCLVVGVGVWESFTMTLLLSDNVTGVRLIDDSFTSGSAISGNSSGTVDAFI